MQAASQPAQGAIRSDPGREIQFVSLWCLINAKLCLAWLGFASPPLCVPATRKLSTYLAALLNIIIKRNIATAAVHFCRRYVIPSSSPLGERLTTIMNVIRGGDWLWDWDLDLALRDNSIFVWVQ